MKMSNFKVFFISDIHFDLNNPKKLYFELKNNFLNEIEKENPDLIILGGDIFDLKVSMNTLTAVYSNKFMHDLYKLHLKLGFGVFIIHGTYSHDNMQILSYSHYMNDNFRIFTEVSSIIYKNKKILILPEEYGKEDYYKEYLQKSVDYVFGHNNFNFLKFHNIGDKSKNTFFEPEIFIKKTRITIFGHYHKYTKYNNIYYPGSFSRTAHGEEEPKGFISFNDEIKGKNKDIFVKFNENKDAPVYKTLKSNLVLKLCNNTDNFEKELKKELNNCDFLRIEVPNTISKENHQLIMGYFKNYRKITLKHIRDTKNKMNIEDKKKFDLQKKYEDKGFFKTTIEEVKKLHDIDLTVSDINEILS